MKKAFTMLELVFVIVVVGIISAMIAPKFGGNNLREAADQLVSHIRYTQHLAMMDEKFDPNNSQWYRERWQILFSLTAGSTISYSILSDTKNSSGNYQGSPKANSTYTKVSVARNILDLNKYLIGAPYSTFDNSAVERLTKKLDLKNEYGILKIDLSNECKLSGSTRIAFDNLGRPLRGTFHGASWNSPYPTSTNINNSKLISKTCRIALCNKSDCSDKNITIAIEKETGYAHILNF